MNLEKLKETARKFEQKEDWRRAIDVYLKAIQQIEEGAETSPDLSLYNRVGDLYLKINDTAAAVRSYERAIDLYADQGFFNNAIALCGKILRVNPGRTQTYLKLAQLHARKNVVIESKRNLIEFLERMNALGQLDQAFQSVKAFADQFSGSQEIRMMLVELLRAASREDEAREQLEKLVEELEASGDTAGARLTRERLQAIEQGEPQEAAPGPAPRAGDLVFLDTGFSPAPAAVPAEPPLGLMPTAEQETEPGERAGAPVDGLETSVLDLSAMDTDAAAPALEPLEIERVVPADVDFEGARLDGMEGTPLDLPDDLEVALTDTDTPSQAVGPAPDIEIMEPLDLEIEVEVPAAAEDSALTFLEIDGEAAAEPLVLAKLEEQVLNDPDNPERHRELAEALFAADQPERAIDELGLALEAYEAREDWLGAHGIVDRFLLVQPDSIRHYQKQVELAYRMGGGAPLIEAYLGLGDALARTGATEKSVAVFRRVQEHDPGNVRAATALAVLVHEPPPAPRTSAPPVMTAPRLPAPPAAPVPPPPAQETFVDFGAMVLEEQEPRDTRMRVDRGEPAGGDEQREFQEILEQFRRGIEANLEDEEYEAHYGLGVAFKEMGLLDEAIAEFQKAIRTPDAEGRMRASEALGIAFYEKGQYAVAETVLQRALTTLDGADDTKIGLIYWLGRASEAQGKEREAVANYERALAVDIRFMDLGDRVRRLAGGPR